MSSKKLSTVMPCNPPLADLNRGLLHCQVCGGPLFPWLNREGSFEELSYACAKTCRGSGYWQIRRIPTLWPMRKVTREDFTGREDER